MHSTPLAYQRPVDRSHEIVVAQARLLYLSFSLEWQLMARNRNETQQNN